jgi:hypothetical protein
LGSNARRAGLRGRLVGGIGGVVHGPDCKERWFDTMCPQYRPA